jgi:hypothetical protein
MKDFVYLIKSDEGAYKIGYSKNPKKRLNQLQTGNSNKLMLVETYESPNSFKIEKTLHRKFGFCKTNGEWFDLNLMDENNFHDYCKIIDNSIIKLKELNNIFV